MSHIWGLQWSRHHKDNLLRGLYTASHQCCRHHILLCTFCPAISLATCTVGIRKTSSGSHQDCRTKQTQNLLSWFQDHLDFWSSLGYSQAWDLCAWFLEHACSWYQSKFIEWCMLLCFQWRSRSSQVCRWDRHHHNIPYQYRSWFGRERLYECPWCEDGPLSEEFPVQG